MDSFTSPSNEGDVFFFGKYRLRLVGPCWANRRIGEVAKDG